MNVPAFAWVILLPLIGSPLAYLAGQVEDRMVPARQQSPWLPRSVALMALAGAWVAFVVALQEPGALLPGPLAMLRADGLSLLMGALALGLGTLVVVYSGPYMAGEHGEEKYYAMLLAMIGAMIGLACTHDLFNLWVWFEAMAVSSYLLVGFYRDERGSLEASVKYLVQSATGSALILLGIALVLMQTGTLDLDQIRLFKLGTPLLLAAGALFTVGFGVKIALVPMHTWLPDAHAQAPSGISAMLSGVVIEAGLLALLRVYAGLSGLSLSWGELLIGFGVINMTVGNLLALRQTQVKRLLAFSSLSHVGYMVFGIGIALYSGQPGGAEGGFFHLLNHGLMKGLAFLTAGAMLYALGFAAGKTLTVTDLNGAARRYPLTALAFSIALLGLAGLPPLAGFMSKWQIFVAGFATQNVAIQVLVLFAALNSVVSLGYYMPLMNAMYRLEPSEAVTHGKALPVVMSTPLAILALAIVAIGLWPALLNWLTTPAGTAILKAFGG
ncbi:MAG TPA: proton-conducting transporter membrane subunit [Aggregatilineaceae bacterium]|nr:proton-conducting transporter membrane subunit [Aggregatilineaceae bacterium]